MGFLTGPAPLVRHVAAPASRRGLSTSAVAAPQQRLHTKEAPKVAGRARGHAADGGDGASSGLGLSATKALVDKGYFVIAGVLTPPRWTLSQRSASARATSPRSSSSHHCSQSRIS